LALGAAVSRRKLAAELNMSLLPVSEALQKLENDGLVESRPRIGTRVCSPSPKDIRERYQVREALESQAARLFAEKASMRERLELQKMAENMDAMFNQCARGSANPDFLYAVHSLHMQLHLRIAECTGCRALISAVEKNQVLVFNWLYDVASCRPALPPRFHGDLIEATCNGSPEDADPRHADPHPARCRFCGARHPSGDHRTDPPVSRFPFPDLIYQYCRVTIIAAGDLEKESARFRNLSRTRVANRARMAAWICPKKNVD
jgi:DNA-binding GntR family transcriptional regulator